MHQSSQYDYNMSMREKKGYAKKALLRSIKTMLFVFPTIEKCSGKFFHEIWYNGQIRRILIILEVY